MSKFPPYRIFKYTKIITAIILFFFSNAVLDKQNKGLIIIIMAMKLYDYSCTINTLEKIMNTENV